MRPFAATARPKEDGWPGAIGRVDLCDVDPDLAPAAQPGSLAALVYRIGAGPLPSPPVPRRGDAHLGFLILKGVLLRDVAVCGRSTAELLGPGDLIQPGSDASVSTLAPAVSWSALSELLVAELAGPVARGLAGDPSAVAAVVGRAIGRAREGALERSIASHVRVDVRLLGYLWHLAERFGKVTPWAVRLELPLTHAVLARLVGARRPTVTTALRALMAHGYLRRDGRAFLLPGDPSAVEELEARSPAELNARDRADERGERASSPRKPTMPTAAAVPQNVRSPSLRPGGG
jgi:CRP-like cAMP-binding protein